MRKYLMLCLLLVVSLAGCTTQSSESADPEVKPTSTGQAYYVSPAGNDSSPGTKDSPWASPAYAAGRIQAGDTLVILGGTYILKDFGTDIIRPNSGTPEAWVIIKGEEGNRPILKGRDNLFAAIDISGKQFIKIENLEITNDNNSYFRGGIDAGGGPIANIILEDLYIHHIDEFGFNAGDVDNLDVRNCVITYCGFGSIGGPEGEHGGWRNVVIKDCELSYNGHYYQGGDGSNRPYDRPDGFGIEPSNGPITIVDTKAEHNRGDGLDSKAGNTTIRNCIVANNSCDGVKLWRGKSRIENTLIYGTGDGVGGGSPWAGIVIGTDDQSDQEFEIVNVTVQDNPERYAYSMYVQYDSDQPMKLLIRNSIFANASGTVWVGESVNLRADYNIFYRPSGGVQIEANGRGYTRDDVNTLGPGNICQDPLFVSPAWGSEGDYRLQAGSPAIDAGTAESAPHNDITGKKRNKVDGFDIGAYEK